MPKRFLKPGLTTSDNWNACDWRTQTFYVRLITLVDDYGRYDGRPAILRAHAFPLHPKISLKDVDEMCEEMARKQLASFYVSGDKTIIQLLRWEEKARSEPRFPAFDNTCKQLYANVSTCCPTSSSPTPSYTPTTTPPEVVEPEFDFPQHLRTAAFMDKWGKWVEYRKTLKKVKNWTPFFQEQLDYLKDFPEPTVISMLSQSLRNGWQGIFELNSRNANSKSNPPVNHRNAGFDQDRLAAKTARVAAAQARIDAKAHESTEK